MIASKRKKLLPLEKCKSIRSYLRRIGAQAAGLRHAFVREQEGKYARMIARIDFSKDGTIDAPEPYAPTELEAAKISADIRAMEWPEPSLLESIALPESISAEQCYEFRDKQGRFVMAQVRTGEGADKKYLPLTHWTDGEWRWCEPESALPLHGMEQNIDAHATVFVHEGAKAALGARQAALEGSGHPFQEHLAGAVHLGWIGGALNPGRADWKALAQAPLSRIYICADNDKAGRQAAPRIAQQLPFVCSLFAWPGDFPPGFDFADEVPEGLFAKGYYSGPAFSDLISPATWLTDLRIEKGRRIYALREAAKEHWLYLSDIDSFVADGHTQLLSPEVARRVMASYAHPRSNPAQLLVEQSQPRVSAVAYAPGKPRYVHDGRAKYNVYVPSRIEATEESFKPWQEFLEYLFPEKISRKEMERWLATLIAQPKTRMTYSVLLVSEAQGVGKTTLGEAVLMPLVGEDNVSFPDESAILSDFNDWLAMKRLAVVNEIYSGHSWKAYNKLKSVVSDKNVNVNRKHMRAHTVQNWCHIFACSNSMRALKIDANDRRWLYPELTEKKWPEKKFDEFYDWLRKGGGLGAIMRWAEEFKNYVAPGEHAPMTQGKAELIEDSKSKANCELARLAMFLAERQDAVAFALGSLVRHVEREHGDVFETMRAVRKIAADAGCLIAEKRVRIDGRLEWIAMSEAGAKAHAEGKEIRSFLQMDCGILTAGEEGL